MPDVAVGPAHVGGKPGTWYQHDLVLQPDNVSLPGDRLGKAAATTRLSSTWPKR